MRSAFAVPRRALAPPARCCRGSPTARPLVCGCKRGAVVQLKPAPPHAGTECVAKTAVRAAGVCRVCARTRVCESERTHVCVRARVRAVMMRWCVVPVGVVAHPQDAVNVPSCVHHTDASCMPVAAVQSPAVLQRATIATPPCAPRLSAVDVVIAQPAAVVVVSVVACVCVRVLDGTRVLCAFVVVVVVTVITVVATLDVAVATTCAVLVPAPATTARVVAVVVAGVSPPPTVAS